MLQWVTASATCSVCISVIILQWRTCHWWGHVFWWTEPKSFIVADWMSFPIREDFISPHWLQSHRMFSHNQCRQHFHFAAFCARSGFECHVIPPAVVCTHRCDTRVEKDGCFSWSCRENICYMNIAVAMWPDQRQRKRTVGRFVSVRQSMLVRTVTHRILGSMVKGTSQASCEVWAGRQTVIYSLSLSEWQAAWCRRLICLYYLAQCYTNSGSEL